MAAVAENSVEFRNAPRRVWEKLQSEVTHDDVEAVAREGQSLPIANDRFVRPSGHSVPRGDHHLGRDVEPDHLTGRTDDLQCDEGSLAGSGRDIENAGL